MPRSSCDPCCNPTEMSRGVEMYRSSVLQILCDILEASGGGLTLTQLPLVTKAFGFFTGAYQAVGFTDAQDQIRFLRIANNTDGVYLISLNNSTDHYRVPAFNTLEIPFGAAGGPMSVVSDVYAKFETAPSNGTVWFEGFY